MRAVVVPFPATCQPAAPVDTLGRAIILPRAMARLEVLDAVHLQAIDQLIDTWVPDAAAGSMARRRTVNTRAGRWQVLVAPARSRADWLARVQTRMATLSAFQLQVVEIVTAGVRP